MVRGVRPIRPGWMSPTAAIDGLVVAVVAFPMFMDAWRNYEGTRQADWITFTLAGISVGALFVRRRWPLQVSLVCGAALTVLYLMDHHGELLNLPTMVGLYTTAVQGDRRRSIIVGAVGSAWSGGLAEVAGSPVGSPVLEMLWPIVPLALGEAVRMRHELLAEYEGRAARAEAEREREAEHRVQTERVRIAREFHDVVAHTMSAVNVQMGVAVAAFDTRPEVARDAVVQARASSKEALRELRATIGLLRDGSVTEALLPAPSIAEIEDLAEPARAAGIAVTVDADLTDPSRPDAPDLPDLPAAVQLAAHRIVQEALTNVIRHANATNAAVSLTREDVELVVEIVDDGQGSIVPRTTTGDVGAAGSDAGYGIVGMTERASALGGRLEYGPAASGGFMVRAILPVESVDQ